MSQADSKNLFSWYKIALVERGVKELRGLADNPEVMKYYGATNYRATHDEVPWCSAFVSWCLQQAGYTSTRSAAAISYEKYGVQISTPVLGCIVVFRRKDNSNPQARHVGFYAGHDESTTGTIFSLGGNQDDQVCKRSYVESRVVGYFLPAHLDDDDAIVYEALKLEAGLV